MLSKKPADPLEIRIYPGANGEFILYETKTTIITMKRHFFYNCISMDNASRQLTIVNVRDLSGMLEKRSFQITLVGKSKGTDIEVIKSPDKVYYITGKNTSCKVEKWILQWLNLGIAFQKWRWDVESLSHQIQLKMLSKFLKMQESIKYWYLDSGMARTARLFYRHGFITVQE